MGGGKGVYCQKLNMLGGFGAQALEVTGEDQNRHAWVVLFPK